MNTLGPRLRHRITIQQQTRVLNGTEYELQWTDVPGLVDEPAEVIPLSGKEFLEAQTTQSQVSARMTIRYRPGVTSAMRVVHAGLKHNIRAVLPDSTGRAWLTLMVTEGTGDGA